MLTLNTAHTVYNGYRCTNIFFHNFYIRKKGKEHAHIFFYELSLSGITVYPAKYK
jgi:hypothetical protein